MRAFALSLLNLLDKCEIDFEEVTYPIAANVFNGVEMALPVIVVEGVDRPNTIHKLVIPYSFALTRIAPSNFSLLYEMMGGSLYISLSSGLS